MPPEKLILAFDTSAAHCAAALLCGGRILAEQLEPMEKGQSERLIPLLEELLEAAGHGWHDLDLIGVGTGPGNFTGIRIAVAAARGLSLSLGIPAIGVTGFEALAEGQVTPIVTALDARRGQLWLSAPGTDHAPTLAMIDSPPDWLVQSRLPVTGHRAEDIAAITLGPVLPSPTYIAAAVAQVALRLSAAAQPRPAPHYLRGADAAPPSEPPPRILS